MISRTPNKKAHLIKLEGLLKIEHFNPHQNDQGRKGPCCFQRLIALKCLKCQKIKKISNPSLLSLLSSEPNFLLIK